MLSGLIEFPDLELSLDQLLFLRVICRKIMERWCFFLLTDDIKSFLVLSLSGDQTRGRNSYLRC